MDTDLDGMMKDDKEEHLDGMLNFHGEMGHGGL